MSLCVCEPFEGVKSLLWAWFVQNCKGRSDEDAVASRWCGFFERSIHLYLLHERLTCMYGRRRCLKAPCAFAVHNFMPSSMLLSLPCFAEHLESYGLGPLLILGLLDIVAFWMTVLLRTSDMVCPTCHLTWLYVAYVSQLFVCLCVCVAACRCMLITFRCFVHWASRCGGVVDLKFELGSWWLFKGSIQQWLCSNEPYPWNPPEKEEVCSWHGTKLQS